VAAQLLLQVQVLVKVAALLAVLGVQAHSKVLVF
jgi:hypothetical protein